MTDEPAPAPDATPAPAPGRANGAVKIFEATEIVKHFGGIQAVRGATMDVERGSITALIGPNGAGKTTFFNLITGFYRPDRGRAVFDGREVHEQAIELLDVFNLTKLADEYAGTLSGGQRKLLELARALMAKPRFLLLDEPMAGINPTLGRRLLDHMQRLRSEDGVTFLFIEHDMEVVMNHADRVIVMAEGTVIADGEPHEVRSDEAVIDAYLGGGGNGAGS